MERVVARVNGDIVTLSEFEARQVAAVQAARVPPGRSRPPARQQRAHPAGGRRRAAAAAAAARIWASACAPNTSQEVIEGIKKENNIAGDAELQQQLRREGMSLDGPEAQHRALHPAPAGPLRASWKGAPRSTEAEARRNTRRTEGRVHHEREPCACRRSWSPGARRALATRPGRARPRGRGLRGPGPRALLAPPRKTRGGDLGRLSRRD